MNYNVDDNGVLKIYYNNEILCGISGCGNSSEEEILDLVNIEIENQIESITNEINYMKKKMECCAYGKRELQELACLENKLEDLENYIKGM